MSESGSKPLELTPSAVDALLVRQFGVSPACVYQQIDQWLAEDAGGGDVSQWTQSPHPSRMRFEIIAKQEFVVCGLSLMAAVLTRTHGQIPVQIASRHADGMTVQPGDVLLAGEGDAGCLLLGERVALNLAARLSGISTKARKMRDIVENAARLAQTHPPQVLETRKTTPGLRMFEKYATRVAGVRNHRHALDTGLMLKENHLRSFGGIARALERARQFAPVLTRVEIEVTNMSEFREALAGGAEVIMLDNFSLADVQTAVCERASCGRNVLLEVSGNLTEANITELCKMGIDFVSSGALIHQATWVDMSMQLYQAV